MLLVKVLKRKDASSVLVAVLLAMIISQAITSATGYWASRISGMGGEGNIYGPSGGDWKSMYLFPVVWAVLQILVLEILGWVYIWAITAAKRK